MPSPGRGTLVVPGAGVGLGLLRLLQVHPEQDPAEDRDGGAQVIRVGVVDLGERDRPPSAVRPEPVLEQQLQHVLHDDATVPGAGLRVEIRVDQAVQVDDVVERDVGLGAGQVQRHQFDQIPDADGAAVAPPVVSPQAPVADPGEVVGGRGNGGDGAGPDAGERDRDGVFPGREKSGHHACGHGRGPFYGQQKAPGDVAEGLGG